jgi:hypothetical protein
MRYFTGSVSFGPRCVSDYMCELVPIRRVFSGQIRWYEIFITYRPQTCGVYNLSPEAGSNLFSLVF